MYHRHPQNINTVGFTTKLGSLDRVASLAWQCLGQRLEMEIPLADLHVILFSFFHAGLGYMLCKTGASACPTGIEAWAVDVSAA